MTLNDLERPKRSIAEKLFTEPTRLAILETNCADIIISLTSSLFVAQGASTYSQGNMGTFGRDYRGGVGKVACWSTKAAISLKHVKIEEMSLWRDYIELTNALSNGTVSDPLRPPLPQDWGFSTPPKTSIAIISGTGKATDFKFGR